MKKRVRGIVTSDKMDRTVAVSVEWLKRHPRYGKYVRHRATYKAHDAHREARLGDLVEIEETRPLSRTKSWRLVRILRRASELEREPELAPQEELQQPGAGAP